MREKDYNLDIINEEKFQGERDIEYENYINKIIAEMEDMENEIVDILGRAREVDGDLLLKEYSYRKTVHDSFLGLFDASVRTEKNGVMAISVNLKCLNQINSYTLNQLRVINRKLYIVPYKWGEELLPGFRKFRFEDETLNTVVTYLDSEDEISKSMSKYSVVNTISYDVTVKSAERIGKFLEIKLLDSTGELPKESFIINNDLFKLEGMLNEIEVIM